MNANDTLLFLADCNHIANNHTASPIIPTSTTKIINNKIGIGITVFVVASTTFTLLYLSTKYHNGIINIHNAESIKPPYLTTLAIVYLVFANKRCRFVCIF